MNIPTKVLRSQFITYETYFHHQQLAKRFYKSTKTKKNQKQNQTEDKFITENDQYSYPIGDFKPNFKEELFKWFFSMSLPERIKAVSIENKWFSTMVQHMYTKFKNDQKIKFQLKFDDITPEELCYQQFYPPQTPFCNDLNLDNFFFFKNDRYVSEDRGVNENLFLKELRYYSLREINDTLTLSTSLLENELLFKYYLDHFSNEKAFFHYCTVSFDNVLKVYNWDFPDWFNPRDFNSVSEFIIAYIEQVISIRFWFSLEEKREKASKTIPIVSFSLYEEPNFNEMFENRQKLINFLVDEYGTCKEKLFLSVIDLKKIYYELKNDTILMSKVKKSKPENMKNYFYYYNKTTKFELFEPPMDNDHEIIEKVRKFFCEQSTESFIDELIFCRLENINSLEDHFFKKIFEVLHNIYTEKNAIDLMNEELSVKKSSSDLFPKSKRGRCKKNGKQKKIRTGSAQNEKSPKLFEVINRGKSTTNNKNDSIIIANLNTLQISTDEFNSHPSENNNNHSSNEKIDSEINLDEDNYENSNKFNNSSHQNKSENKEIEFSDLNKNHVVLTVNNENKTTQKLETSTNNTQSINNINSETKKMSWRKMTPNEEDKKGININTVNPTISKNKKLLNGILNTAQPEEKLPLSNDEIFVNDLVKNLLTQIIIGDDKTANEKIDKTFEKSDSIHQVIDRNVDNDYEDLKSVTSSKSYFTNNQINKNLKQTKKSKVIYPVNNKINSNSQSNTYLKSNNNNKSSKLYNDDNSQNAKNSSIKYKQNKKSFKKEKQQKEYIPKNHKLMELSQTNDKVETPTESTQNEQENPNEISLQNFQINLPSNKSYSSDNECKIVTMNHEIIQPSQTTSNSITTEMRKVMVDNFSQTDLKKDKVVDKVTEYTVSNITSEAIHSSTHDDEEKPKENTIIEDEKNSTNINNKNIDKNIDKPLKKKKKNLYINNFKLEKESDNSNYSMSVNSSNKTSPQEANKKISATPSTDDYHFDLKKCISEGYNFANKKDVKLSTNNNSNNLSNNLNNTSNNNFYNKSSVTNSRKSSSTFSMTTSEKNNYSYIPNHNEEEYGETDDSFSPNYSKSTRYGYNKNYYGANYYNKKSKYNSYSGFNNDFNGLNGHGFNTNKFNNPDLNQAVNKQINNRPFYSSRPNLEYNPYFAGSNQYSMLGNYPMNPTDSNYKKDPPVYNNYYIINSNVNINNVQNFNQTTDKENELNLDKENPSKDINKNVNIFANYNNGVVCNNYIKYPEGYKNGNFSPYNNPQGMFSHPSFLFHGPASNQNIIEDSNLNNNMNNNSSNILSKIEGDLYPFIFHYRIHNDILEYSKSVTETISYFKEIKMFIIKYLENIIKNALGFDMMTDLYGSYATDLSIESSDIDITIKFTEVRNELETEEIIHKLCFNFKNLQVFDSINPILTASVPVIKILIDPSKILEKDSEEMKQFINLKNSGIYKNYKFDHEELLKIKVDLTFIEINNKIKPQSTKNSLDWAKKTLATYPEIKPIIHVLKRYLQIKKLNSSFNGGLSSFSLFLLIVAYLKYQKIKTRMNLGRILLEMLELYGKYFQYAQSKIDVNSVNPYTFTNDFLENFPVILDPVTGLNVAKNSFRIEEVRESFSQAYDFINRLKILFDKKDLPNTTNVILDLMLQNKETCKFL